jgi:hypothetical protein
MQSARGSAASASRRLPPSSRSGFHSTAAAPQDTTNSLLSFLPQRRPQRRTLSRPRAQLCGALGLARRRQPSLESATWCGRQPEQGLRCTRPSRWLSALALSHFLHGRVEVGCGQGPAAAAGAKPRAKAAAGSVAGLDAAGAAPRPKPTPLARQSRGQRSSGTVCLPGI